MYSVYTNPIMKEKYDDFVEKWALVEE